MVKSGFRPKFLKNDSKLLISSIKKANRELSRKSPTQNAMADRLVHSIQSAVRAFWSPKQNLLKAKRFFFKNGRVWVQPHTKIFQKTGGLFAYRWRMRGPERISRPVDVLYLHGPRTVCARPFPAQALQLVAQNSLGGAPQVPVCRSSRRAF